MNTPNKLSILRVLLIPPMVLLLYLNKTRAMVVPKRTMGDRVDDVKGLIERHIPNKKRVRWRRG